jgi:hypothetical protein
VQSQAMTPWQVVRSCRDKPGLIIDNTSHER